MGGSPNLGFNFGIVLEATYKIQPLINGGDMTNVDMIFPANKSSDFFDALVSYGGSMPSKLASVSLISWNASPSVVSSISLHTPR